MNIAYFSRSLPDSLYEDLLNEGHALNNPSNQNFHARLIASIRNFAKVDTYFTIPKSIPKGALPHFGNDHLLNLRLGFIPSDLPITRNSAHKIDVAIFDALAPRLGHMAIRWAKHQHIPTVAVLTDNPQNIANSSFLYQKAVQFLLTKVDAVITILPSLITKSRTDTKIFLLPGIVRDEPVEKMNVGHPYIYFAGAMSSRWGLPDFVNVYLASKCACPLYIAGHSGSFGMNDRRVVYLGQLTERENAAYQAGASLLINSRPLDRKIDSESIPSKLFEYLASGSPVLSTKHPYFFPRYENDVEFIDQNGFPAYFASHLDKGGSLINVKPNNAQASIVNEYGVSRWSQPLKSFLEEVMASSSVTITRSKE